MFKLKPRILSRFMSFRTDPRYDISYKREVLKEKNQVTDLLDSSLPFVSEFGWTKTSIIKGAEELGWTGVAHGICPRGPIELVEHFIELSTAQLVRELELQDDFKELLFRLILV